MNKSKLIDIVGWIGMVLVLGSYFLISAGVLNSNMIKYHLMVVSGCAMLIILNSYKKIWQSVAINATVLCFSIFAIIRLLFFK